MKESRAGFVSRRFFAVVMCMVMVLSIFTLTGCGKEKETAKQQIPLKLYYENLQYVETGDETLEPLVMVEWNGLEIPEDLTKEEIQTCAYIAAITQLQNVPEDVAGIDTAIPMAMELNSITVKDGVALVDLGDGLESELGGSLGEGMFISQIVETLVNSFDEINKVQFLIDGQSPETLAGHFDVSEPFEHAVIEKAEQ